MTSVKRNWDDYGEITTENRMSDKNPPAKADGFLPVGSPPAKMVCAGDARLRELKELKQATQYESCSRVKCRHFLPRCALPATDGTI